MPFTADTPLELLELPATVIDWTGYAVMLNPLEDPGMYTPLKEMPYLLPDTPTVVLVVIWIFTFELGVASPVNFIVLPGLAAMVFTSCAVKAYAACCAPGINHKAVISIAITMSIVSPKIYLFNSLPPENRESAIILDSVSPEVVSLMDIIYIIYVIIIKITIYIIIKPVFIENTGINTKLISK
jgi:hypothetical protein